MTVPVPDKQLWRRIQALEHTIEHLSAEIRRVTASRSLTPLTGRIWLFTCTGEFTGKNAAADLYDLDETDTAVNITVEDPLMNWETLSLGTGSQGVCEEQIDLKGKRHYIVVEWKCP
jgi:hypothetical protein